MSVFIKLKEIKMIKFKRVIIALLLSTILLAGVVLVFASSTTTAPAKPERVPPVVLVMPNVGTPRAKVNFVGANFKPDEEVIVTILMFPDVETNLSGSPKGLTTKVDELGSFQIKRKLPLYPGVYPVRVYDERGEILCTSLVMVVKAEEKK